MTKTKKQSWNAFVLNFEHSGFNIVSDFEFRISDFHFTRPFPVTFRKVPIIILLSTVFFPG